MNNNCPYVVYVLRSLSSTHSRKTYVGCTKDRFRRLRQHNGEIQGGAKRTIVGRPWEMVCYFHGFPDKRTAYQLEYAIHHSGMKKTTVRTRKGNLRKKEYLDHRYRGGGMTKRLELITLALQKPSFTLDAIPTYQLHLTLNWLVDNLSLNMSFPYLIEIRNNNSNYSYFNSNSNSNNNSNYSYFNSNSNNNDDLFTMNSTFINNSQINNFHDDLFHINSN